jgi:hypothetical protein
MSFDPATGGLNGVTDWGDVQVGDRGLDYFVGFFEVGRALSESASAS